MDGLPSKRDKLSLTGASIALLNTVPDEGKMPEGFRVTCLAALSKRLTHSLAPELRQSRGKKEQVKGR